MSNFKDRAFSGYSNSPPRDLAEKFLKTKFSKWLITSSIMGATLLGLNYKNIRDGNILMAQPILATSPEQVTRLSLDAKNSFIDFILTGNVSSRRNFLDIRAANLNNSDFTNAFAQHLQDIRNDSRFRLMFNSFRIETDSNSNLTLPDFLQFIDTLWQAARTGNQQSITRLRREMGEDFVNVAVSFLAAREFNGILSSRDPEIREQHRDIVRNVFRSITLTDNSLPPAFREHFFTQISADSQSVLNSYRSLMRERNNNRNLELNGPMLIDAATDTEELYNILRLSGYDRSALNRLYSSEFVDAIRSIVVRNSIPVSAIVTQESIETKINQLEERLRGRTDHPEENLLVGSVIQIISTWRARLHEAQTQADLDRLTEAIPQTDEIDNFIFYIRRTQGKIRDLLDNPTENYYVLSDTIFVSRLINLVSSAQTASNALERALVEAVLPANTTTDRWRSIADAIQNANRTISSTLSAFDSAVRNGTYEPSMSTSLSSTINNRVDELTNAMYGNSHGSNDAAWIAHRSEIARRLLIQYIRIPPNVDPVNELVRQYSLTSEDDFRSFLTTRLPEAVARHIGNLSAEVPVADYEILLNTSRTSVANRFNNAMRSVSPLVFRAAYDVLIRRNHNSEEAAIRSLDDTNEMAKFCSLLVAFSSLPAPYAAFAIDRIGRQLLDNYDDASIMAIGQVIATASSVFVANASYQLLDQYYSSLPDKLRRLFPDAATLQREGREPGNDVRVRMPNEDPTYSQLFLPNMNMYVRIPKRVYEGWYNQTGFLHVARAPDITYTNTTAPNFMATMQRFLERPIAEGRANIPLPMFRLPFILQNAGTLMPDRLPTLGDHIGDQLNIAGNGTYESTQSTTSGSDTGSSTSGGLGATYNRVIEGGTMTSSANYRISTRTGGQTTHAFNAQVNNWRVTNGYNVNQALVEGQVTTNPDGTPQLDNIRMLLGGMAPAGAQTAIMFRYVRNNDIPRVAAGSPPQTYQAGTIEARVFQRFANGSFVEIDSVPLSSDAAHALYERNFHGPLQTMYFGGRAVSGDWMGQIDGAILFAAPMRETTNRSEPASDSPLPQGIGFATQYRNWGGAADYEVTRRGRTSGLFGYINRNSRVFAVGRVSAQDVTSDPFGRSRGFFEFRYMNTDRVEVRGFVGHNFSTNEARDIQAAGLFNYVNRDDPFLGLSSLGAGGGRIVRETAGVDSTGTVVNASSDEFSGGRFYGIGQDMISGFVGGFLMRNYQRTLTVAPTTSDRPSSFGADPNALSTTDTLQNGATRNTGPSEITQQLASAGFRWQLSRAIRIDTGFGYDMLHATERGGFANFQWSISPRTGLNLQALVFPINNETLGLQTTGLAGASLNTMIGFNNRLSLEGYGAFSPEGLVGGAGELRIRRRTPSLMGFDLSLGGGYVPDLSEGAHLGVGIPLSARTTLGVAGSYAIDTTTSSSVPNLALTADNILLRTGDAILGVTYRVPIVPGERLRAFNVSGAISGAVQTSSQESTQLASAYQLDATAALQWVTTRSTWTAQVGAQVWHTEHRTGNNGLRFGATGSLRFRGTRWGNWLFPTLGADLSVTDSSIVDNGTTSDKVNVTVNLNASIQH